MPCKVLTSADVKALMTLKEDKIGQFRVYNWCRQAGVKIFTPKKLAGMLGKGDITLKIGEGSYGDCYRLITLHESRDWVLKKFYGKHTSESLLKELKALKMV
ncbi:hypothetical protein Pmani_019987 [Petrolisthes manimaculis]|uniref:Uncharacterized protein n=1 Tax=Petrolisthes manimaculis TaxID=1843537 RepID=A0AAE1PJB5_9EUCA|nr:hypothetical protein Pmani_019987 [Petrolisthes manimaculis]